MLVAKLDFLQLLVIKGSLAAAAKRTSQLWRALQKAFADGAPESSSNRCGNFPLCAPPALSVLSRQSAPADPGAMQCSGCYTRHADVCPCAIAEELAAAIAPSRTASTSCCTETQR